MNIDELVDMGVLESRELDYKHPGVDVKGLVEELVALANSGGGSIIVGVEEDGDEIVDLYDVTDASEREEGIQLHIREKVNPKLSVTRNVEKYTGKNEEWHGNRLLVLSTEPGEQMYSYKESDKQIVFPYRLGSTTGYITGNEMFQYYRHDVRPGRSEEDQSSEESQTKNRKADLEESAENGDEKEDDTSPWQDIAEAVATVAENQTKNKSDEENKGGEKNYDIELSPSETPYYFTPSGGLETITFHHFKPPYQAYGIEGTGIRVNRDQLKQVFGALKECFDAQLEDGHFTITQRNAAWYGRGVADFVEATKVDSRYSQLPDSFELDTHHSEGTIFIADSRLGTIIVRSRRGINVGREFLDQFAVSFCTDGVPVDTRAIEKFLSTIDASTHHAQSFDLNREQVQFGHKDIEVEPVKLIQSKHNDNFVGRAICENPFYENPDLLLTNIDSEKTDFETLTKYRWIPCRIKDHHPVDKPKQYKLLKTSITPLTPVQGLTPHANAMVWINW